MNDREEQAKNILADALAHDGFGPDTFATFIPKESALRAIIAAVSVQPPESTKHPDDVAVDLFASAMKAKLEYARNRRGRGGWQNKSECSADDLSAMLRDHVSKGDPTDVANFCCFLWNRQEAISAPPDEIYVDFREVGTAGPFPIVDGRVVLPDVTMNDLINHARTGYVATPLSREVSALVAEWRQRPGITDAYKICANELESALGTGPQDATGGTCAGLTFEGFRAANVARCVKWHPNGISSWSPADWLTAVTGELGELASLLKMRNRERDGLPGNKFSPTDKMVADELADVLTYLDLLAEALKVDLGRAAVAKFNEVSERVGFPDRINL